MIKRRYDIRAVTRKRRCPLYDTPSAVTVVLDFCEVSASSISVNSLAPGISRSALCC